MTEVVIFPDVEAALVQALPALVGVPVVTRVPNPRPASFVRLTRVGGTSPNRVTDAALVVFECWASSEVAASDLGRLTRAHVFALAQSAIGDDYVRRVREIGGLQAFPDPVSKSPRYQFSAQIDLRGEVLT